MLAVIEAIEKDEDRRWVERLYNQYSKLIVWKINQLVYKEEAKEDLLQETFVHIIRNIDVLKTLEEYKIKPYIMTIVHNVCMDYLRKEQKKEKNEKEWDESDVDIRNVNNYNPEKIFADKELMKGLWRNIDKLNKRDKSIILYRYAYNMSYKNIALELGIENKNINMYVKRAKDRLKKILMDEVKGNEWRKEFE